MTAGPTIEVPDIDLVGIAAILIAIGVIWAGVKVVLAVVRFINQFRDDWFGFAGDENHPPRPGVLAQMQEMRAALVLGEETRQLMATVLDSMVKDVTQIKDQVGHELTHNNGSSTKDAAHEAKRLSKATMDIVENIQMQQEAEVLERKDWTARFEADQRRQRKAMHKLVLRMIREKPADQETIWNDDGKKWIEGELEDGENVG